MKAEIRDYIKNTIGRLNDAERKNDYNDKVCLLKYYTGFSVEESEIINITASVNVKCEIIFHRFSRMKVQEVYSPFTSFIREMYLKYYADKMSAEEFVENAGCYKALSFMYAQYLSTGHFRRKEDIIRRENDYERTRITMDMINFLKYITKERKLVIVLDRIQEAHESSIGLLEQMIMDTEIHNIVIIGAFNETLDVNNYMRTKWNNLISYIRSKDMAVDYEDDTEDTEQRDVFVPKSKEVDEYLCAINDMLLTMAFGQAKYYLEIIYSSMESSNLELSSIQKMNMINLYTKVLMYNGEERIAYVYCKKMYDIDIVRKKPELLYEYYYTLTQVYLAGNQVELANEQLELTYKYAKQLNKQKIIETDMLHILILLDKYPDVLIWGMEVVVDKELLKIAKDNDMTMHLAYACVFGVDLSANSVVEGDGNVSFENIPDFIEGIRIAAEVGNEQLLIRGWQRAAVQAGAVSNFDEVIYCYTRCLEIMEGLDRKHEEAKINNGMGYTSLISEKYENACGYFKKAIKIGIEVNIPKYILDAVYNMSIGAIAVGKYDAAIKCIETDLRMMSGMGIERLNVCNKTKLYGLLIYSYIKQGHMYNAKLYMDMMETGLDHILSVSNPNITSWEDDLYLYYFDKSMLYICEGEYRQAKRLFAVMEELRLGIKSKQNYILSRVTEEEIRLFDILGEKEERDKLIKERMKIFEEIGLKKSTKRLSQILVNEEPDDYEETHFLSDEEIKKINHTSDWIEMKLGLEKKEKLLSFFENWVDSLNDEYLSIDQMVNNSMLIVKNAFDIDSVLHIKINNDSPEVSYYDGISELKKYQLKYICDYFDEHRRRIIVSRFLKSYRINEELISAFNVPDIAAMIAIPYVEKEIVTDIFVVFKYKRANYLENLRLFTEEEADVLKTVFSELLEAIERETIKQQIEKNAVTDMLTGIYNRQGMKKSFDKLISISKDKSASSKKQFTILYMDLDNFKYCNDHFGHDVGDGVLKAFAKMLRDIVEPTDVLVRYGGDEFVVILPDSGISDGIEVAEKIFANIKHTKGFKKAIEKIRHEKVDIPEENRITCSIGIATGNAGTYFGLGGILKKADESLYYVKRTTKHSYKVWEQSIRDGLNMNEEKSEDEDIF